MTFDTTGIIITVIALALLIGQLPVASGFLRDKFQRFKAKIFAKFSKEQFLKIIF